MKLRDVKVSHHPASAMRVLGFAPVPKMLEKGICVSIGTDGASSSNRMDIVDEMWLTSLIHKGWRLDPTVVPSTSILRMATKNGARALGDEDLYGMLSRYEGGPVVITPTRASMMRQRQNCRPCHRDALLKRREHHVRRTLAHARPQAFVHGRGSRFKSGRGARRGHLPEGRHCTPGPLSGYPDNGVKPLLPRNCIRAQERQNNDRGQATAPGHDYTAARRAETRPCFSPKSRAILDNHSSLL